MCAISCDRAAAHSPPCLLYTSVLQAPVFHGHAFAIYLETEKPVAVADLSQALSGEHVVVSGSPEDTPTNVSAAGQEDILVSVSYTHLDVYKRQATTNRLQPHVRDLQRSTPAFI